MRLYEARVAKMPGVQPIAGIGQPLSSPAREAWTIRANLQRSNTTDGLSS